MYKDGRFTVLPIILPTKYSLKSFNFYLFEQDGLLTLIDAGINTDECWNLLLQTLKENGYALTDIQQILLTHNHDDHSGLVNRLTSVKDVPVYAHKDAIHRLKREKSFFEARVSFFEQMYKEMGCGEAGEEQVRKLEKAMGKHEDKKILSDIFPIKHMDMIGDLQVIATPGHSSDHVIFLHKKTKWLFAGDHLIEHISSNALVEPDSQGNRIPSLLQYMNSLKDSLNIEAEVVFSGHGELIEDPQSLIKLRLTRMKEKAERILQLIKQGFSTGKDLAVEMYGYKYKKEFSLVMSEIVGHLDYLELHNRLAKEMKDGVWYYRAING